jgi:uncharacterized protein YcaQ
MHPPAWWATNNKHVCMAQRNSLSIVEARRIALAAQQFGGSAPALRSVAAVARAATKLGAIQIDSVNVLTRSHYLPLQARYGAYPRELLERAAYADSGRRLFEYWGHECSFLPIETFPLFRWRMERARAGLDTWGRLRRYATQHRAEVEAAIAEIRERGPLGASELTQAGKSKGGWWGWSQGKEILEWLFWTGVVTTARRRNFERLYDLTERVIPESALAIARPTDEAHRELLLFAAQALGVATLGDLRDYFRLPAADAKARLAELLEAGELASVQVEGWKQQAYVRLPRRIPRRISAAALLSPFDSLIWERQRTERLFDFRFRLEIYTPAHKRVHGYYVLPFLYDERLVARVDLKSDRARACLQVRGASIEQGVAAGRIVEPLAACLKELASWLNLERVEIVSRRGELIRLLKRLK